MEWVAYALIGLCTGLCTAIMANSEVHMIHEKRIIADLIIGGDEGELLYGWLFFSGLSIFLVFIASAATRLSEGVNACVQRPAWISSDRTSMGDMRAQPGAA